MDAIGQLELLAKKLGELSQEIVVIGGCTPALILDVTLAPDLRPTYDVDILVHVDSYGNYINFIEKIKKRGFIEREGDPIGRYVSGELVIDVVPTESHVLGFTNRWYSAAFAKAVDRKLPSGKIIKTVTPVYFIATKFEALRGRGKDDLMTSPDLEDIITVMVEHPDCEEELRKAEADVRQYITAQCRQLLSHENYPHFLSAHLRGDEASQASLTELRKLIEKIASGKF